MTRCGYFLSCEEYPPADLVRPPRLAGQVGGEAEGFFESYPTQVLPCLRER